MRADATASGPSPPTLAAVLALLAALLVLPLALAPRAEAYIYWTNADDRDGHWIGRANLDGTGVEQGFIKLGTGASTTSRSTTGTSTGRTRRADTIGRAKLDGTGVVPNFFRAPGALFCYPRPAAAPRSLWRWTRTTSTGRPIGGIRAIGGIGRAKLDGTGVDADFVSGISRRVPSLSTATTSTGPNTRIGRRSAAPSSTARRWTRASSAGFTPSRRRRRPRPHLLDRYADPEGHDRPRQDRRHRRRAAVHHPTRRPGWRRSRRQAHLLDRIRHRADADTIGRAKLDGTDVKRAFIDRIWGAGAIAVDGLGPPGKATAKPTQRQKGKKIVVKVKVKARERLTAKASGEIKVNPTYKLRPKKVQVAAGKTKTLRLKPKKKAARKIATALKRGEKAKAKVTVKLTDRAGNTRDREAAGEAEARVGGPRQRASHAHVASAVARHGRRGWRLDKANRADKIDAVVALAMALDRVENRPAPTRLVGWL